MEKKFTCYAARWFDSVNGNTYHSVRVIRHEDEQVIVQEFTYGYDDHYRQTALKIMLNAGWLPGKYNDKNLSFYERENNYPIDWVVSDGSKKDCSENSKV